MKISKVWATMASEIKFVVEHRFGMDFGRVWGGFWEVKNFDFSIFFDVVSMLKLEGVLKGRRSQKKIVQVINHTHLGPARRNVRGAGERKREGSEACWDRILEKIF